MKGHWSEKAVIYQIYPRSFMDSDGDGIGDLKGIIQKLDYLNDGTEGSLGVNTIWLSPIFESPNVDWGYDVSDHRKIDPDYGTMADLEELIKEAGARGIKVMLDFVPNHTSTEHAWFKESRSSKGGPKRDWYIWKEPAEDGGPPNNWLSRFGGSAWSLDEMTGQYYLHTFFKEQADLNWRNEEVRKEMLDIMRFWFEKGIDGFRIDAINHVYKDEKFRDEPTNPEYDPKKHDPYRKHIHIRNIDQPETLEMVADMCRLAEKCGNKFLVGEASLNIDQMLDFYGKCDNGLFSPFNFNLIRSRWFAQDFREFIDDYDRSLPGTALPNYVFGNHDKPRLINRLGKRKARVAAMLLLTMRGVPFIYYGDELGAENVWIPKRRRRDTLEERVPGYHLGRDPERAPMRWDSGKLGGFTTGKPWLPVGWMGRRLNVGSERQDPGSMLNLYRKLIHLKNSSEALSGGSYRSIETGCEHVFGYLREEEGESVLVLLNFKRRKSKLSLKMKGKARILLSTASFDNVSGLVDLDGFKLGPDEGIMLALNQS